jgi:uncharacterized protein
MIMEKRMLPVLAALFLLGCDSGSGLIEASGQGSVEVAPDLYHLRLALEERGERPGELEGRMEERLKAVLELARGKGLDDEDIEARALSVNRDWRWGREREQVEWDFVLRREIVLRVASAETVPDLLQGLLRLDVDQIYQPEPRASDPDALESKALELAVEDARRRASTAAAQAGRRLGELHAMQIYPGSGPVMRQEAARMRQDAPVEDAGLSFEPGRISVSVRIQASFEHR